MADEEAAFTFADLELREELLAALTHLGYEEPTPIQREAIPPLVAGNDLLGQAATGTGKTAAFALPIVQRLPKERSTTLPTSLVLVPTRELAMQVSEAMHKYGRNLGLRVLPVYGGQPIRMQLRALERGVDVVVATPGRAVDHLNRGTLKLDEVGTVVLDEADEMLDMGFQEDLEALLDAAPAPRQTVLFSATMPPRLSGIVNRHLTDPVRIEIRRSEMPGTASRVRQTAYIVRRESKPAALGRLLDVEAPTAALVFCRTRDEVDTLTETLNGRGYRAEALHGGMSQQQRDRVMGRLRAGNADLLLATDVAARGLDIDLLTHVVNYDVPSSPETYVHRIGRVGRAGREGTAITLAQPREHRMLRTIEQVTKQKISVEKIPTVADLRQRRLELTRAGLEESLLEDSDLDHFRVVVETLSETYDVMDVAAAAVKLAHELGGGPVDEEEIPDVQPPAARGGKGLREDRPQRTGGARRENPDMTRIFIGAGRVSGIRPKDLVGAITNEAGLAGRDIGGIEIADRFSLVEVPSGSVDGVITALRGSTIKGKKATIRRERFPSGPRR